jgi:DNA-directed RNA polymerase subunit RPC12/RpoP
MRRESQLMDEGPSSYFCVVCNEKVGIFNDEETKCPKCGKDQLIGYNVTKCPKCKIGNLKEETGSSYYKPFFIFARTKLKV